MKRPDNFFAYLRTSDGRLALAMVAACALVIAYFVGRSLVVPLPKSYQLDFGKARWIESSTASQSGYFRKTLYIPGRVDHAWVEIAASDSFDLYVNNFKFAQHWLTNARPSKVYEIAALLRPGKNVLAIHVNRLSFPGAGQVRARGFYSVPSSPLQEFISDASWKASGTPEGLVGGYQWSAPQLDDSSWAGARETTSGEWISTVQAIKFDPRLLQTRPVGKWIVPPQFGGQRASFVYHLKLDSLKPQQVWMRLAATGPYDIIVNGRLAFTQAADLESVELALASNSNRTGLGFSNRNVGPLTESPDLLAIRPSAASPVARITGNQLGVPEPSASPGVASPPISLTLPAPPTAGLTNTPRQLGETLPFTALAQPSTLPDEGPVVSRPAHAAPVLLTYDISDWLKSGDNLIICRVQPENGQVALLAELVRDLHNGQLSRVGTGSDWQTIVNDVPGLVETKSAHVVGVYGDPPWGVLPQALSANLPSAPTQDLRTILTWLVIIVATLALVFLLWIATSLLGAKISGRPLTQHCNSDALVHLAAVGPALLMLLLAYDVRFDLDWCFTPTITAGLILLLLSAKGLVLLFSRSASEPASVREPQPVNARWRRFWKLAAIGVIMLVGFALRAPNLTAVSLDNDEFGIVQYADGVLTAGYPFITLGSFKKTATTYELVSYSVAASRALFGTNEAAFRFPSLFFGILTIGLIAWVGYRLVDWRVGLVAAVIYAFFPCAVWWSRNAFYPMQEQFLALLTMWCFYEAIRTRPIHRAYLTAASVAFVLAYLSWEGSGFLIPAMFVCMFAMKWGEYDWIGDWHLWRCFFLVTCVVLIQLIHRQFASMPTYLQIGVSIADVSTPELVYLDPTTYDPGFYFRNCLLQENFYVMSLVLFAGIAFCWKHRGIRYLFVMFVSLLICYTEFLPAYAIRYSNNYHTLIILISVAVLFELWDRISSIDIPNEIRALRTLRWEAPAALVLILILSANGYILKTYRLSNNPDVPIIGGRIGVYKTDYRGVARFAASKWSPGDALIVTIPHIFEFYARRDVDYSSSTTFGKVVTYDGGQASPAFIDKFRGRPAVRGVEEIDSLRSRYRRLWVLQVGAADLFDDLTTEYLRQKGRVVYESYRCRIVLVEGTHASAIDIKQKEREINRPSWRVTSD